MRAHLVAQRACLLEIDMRRLSEAILSADAPRETSCNCIDVTVSPDEARGLIGPRWRVETRMLPPQLGSPVESAAQRARQRGAAGARRTRRRIDRERLLRERSLRER